MKITRDADADLVSIFTYLAKAEQSDDIAEHYIRRLYQKLEWIAESGMTGVNRDFIRPGLRALIFEAHCIYFYHDGDNCVIVRILHGHMDIDKQNLSGI